MASVIQSIDVDVDVTTAYNQWTQFGSFPNFMSGVNSIHELDDTRTRWQTSIGGIDRAFDTEITEQHPDERVAWKSVDGTTHAGAVTFHHLNDQQTRVTAQIGWKPEGMIENVGATLGVDNRQIKGDLQRFKQFIERRGDETGARRGNVEHP